LEAEKGVLEALNPHAIEKTKTDISKDAGRDTSTNAAGDLKLKMELAEALRSKGQFEARLRTADEELQKLRTKTSADAKIISSLTAERNALVTKLKDLGHEAREKWKLVQVRTDINIP
jgi:uncharacterized protein involved in exopolysaccharide biosynthesis